MKKIFKAEYITVFILLLVLIRLFFISPVLGVADNGDFERIMYPAGLDFVDGREKAYFFDYTTEVFQSKPIFLWGFGHYATTHIIPVRIAKLFNDIFYPKGFFNLRFLAVLYSVLFLIAIYYITKNLKTNAKWINGIIAFLIVWILGDATNLVYFNSLYGEATSYVSLLLMIGFILNLHKTNKVSSLVWFFISAIFFFGSKLQYTLLMPISIVLTIFLVKKYQNYKKLIISFTAFAIIINCFIYYIAPKSLSEDTLYNSVFFGILKDSPNISQDLKDLDLPSYMEALHGTHAYEVLPIDKNTEQFHKDFYQKIGRGDVIKYYFTHFDRLLDKMRITANNAYDNQIGMMGNFSIDDAKYPHKRNHFFTSYNSFKRFIFLKNFWVIIAFFILLFLAVLKKRNIITAFCMMIMLVGAIQFPLPIIGNGEADIAKQLFVFNAIVDCMLMGVVIYILNLFKRHVKNDKIKCNA